MIEEDLMILISELSLTVDICPLPFLHIIKVNRWFHLPDRSPFWLLSKCPIFNRKTGGISKNVAPLVTKFLFA